MKSIGWRSTTIPTSDYLNAGLAELYAKTGRIRDAVLEAQDILKRDGNNLEARRLLGRIYLRSLGDMQAGTQSQEVLKLAIEQYEQIVKLDPKSVEDHLLLGRLYRLNNELLKSEDEFKTAVKIQPDSEEAVTTLAYLYNEEGDSARALQVLSAIPESARTAKLYSALGFTYEQQKDYKKAIDAYRRSTELDRDNLDSVRGLAQNLMNDGQTDAALEQYKVIADADPSDAQTYMRIAEIDRRNGKFDQALEALKKATAVVPDSLEVQYNIAVIDEAQGKYEDAIQILNQLLQKTEHPTANTACPTRTTGRFSWSAWARCTAKPTSTSRRWTPSARCLTSGMKMPFAAISRLSKPTATISSGKWQRRPRRRPPRNIPMIAACRWFRPRNRPTWASPMWRSSM